MIDVAMLLFADIGAVVPEATLDQLTKIIGANPSWLGLLAVITFAIINVCKTDRFNKFFSKQSETIQQVIIIAVSTITSAVWAYVMELDLKAMIIAAIASFLVSSKLGDLGDTAAVALKLKDPKWKRVADRLPQVKPPVDKEVNSEKK